MAENASKQHIVSPCNLIYHNSVRTYYYLVKVRLCSELYDQEDI